VVLPSGRMPLDIEAVRVCPSLPLATVLEDALAGRTLAVRIRTVKSVKSFLVVFCTA
jgi:hypothetical protein